MKKNFLAVDVGNTSAHFVPVSGERFGREYRVKTSDLDRAAVGAVRRAGKIEAVVIASVVPKAVASLKKAAEKIGVPALVIGRDVPVPIANRYKNPRQVGIDRLLNAYAGYRQYRREMIVLDFGTAITFDIVSRKGEYLGGIIAPGIELSLDALFQKTALLPKIRLKHPQALIARDTVESIRVGCSVGIGGLCDRVVEELRRKHLKDPLILATGGYAGFMRRYCRSIQKIDPRLVLKGISWSYRIFSKNR